MLLIPLIGAAFYDLLMDKLKAGEKTFLAGKHSYLKKLILKIGQNL